MPLLLYCISTSICVACVVGLKGFMAFFRCWQFVRLTSKGGGTTELKSLRVALAFGLALQTEEEADGAAEEASGSLSSSFLFSKERYYRITHSQRVLIIP